MVESQTIWGWKRGCWSSAADGAYCPGLFLGHKSCGKVNRAVGIYVGFSLLPRNDLLRMRDTSPGTENNSGTGFISLKSSADSRGLGCL